MDLLKRMLLPLRAMPLLSTLVSLLLAAMV